MSGLHIGDLARATGRSAHTIRWYETQGLIPNVGRDRGGRRVYDPLHVEWLNFLDRLRFSGMPIREMRVYAELASAGKRTLADRERLLEAHAACLAARIEELTAARSLIEDKVRYYREWRSTGARPDWMPGNSPSRVTRRRTLAER